MEVAICPDASGWRVLTDNAAGDLFHAVALAKLDAVVAKNIVSRHGVKIKVTILEIMVAR
jgi:hypothetical protein